MVRRMFATALAAALMIGTGYAQQAPAAAGQAGEARADRAEAVGARADRAEAAGARGTAEQHQNRGDDHRSGRARRSCETHREHDRRGQEERVASAAVDKSQTTSGRFNVSLNVDATPTIVKDGLMRLDLSLEYSPKPGSENASSGEGRSPLNERLSLLVESGKPLIDLAGVRSDLGPQDDRAS